MLLQSSKLMASGLATISNSGAGIGIGIIFAALIVGIARNPSLTKNLFMYAILGVTLTAAAGLTMAFLIIVGIGYQNNEINIIKHETKKIILKNDLFLALMLIMIYEYTKTVKGKGFWYEIPYNNVIIVIIFLMFCIYLTKKMMAFWKKKKIEQKIERRKKANEAISLVIRTLYKKPPFKK